MIRLLLVAIILFTAAFVIAYNLGYYQESRKRKKIAEDTKAKAEFEKNIDKLADAILKRKYK